MAMTTATLRPPLFVVFNIGSGHGNADEAAERIGAACRDADRPCELLRADRPDRIPQLAEDAVTRAKAVGGIVVAAGGDGTINTVAQAVLGSGCAFGVLPQGTFNYFSRTHGISSELDVAVAQLLGNEPQPVQVGMVNERVFLVNASLGLYPKLLEDREAWKRQYGRSRLVAFGAGLRTMLGTHRQLDLHVLADGEKRELRTSTLFVGNNELQLRQIGISESVAIERCALAAISLKPVGRFEMASLLIHGAFGRLGDADQVQSFGFRSMTVDSRRRGKTGRVKVATDGEVCWMRTPLRFEVAAEPLMLIKPDAASRVTE